MEAHGGYLCRIEGFGPLDPVALAREAVRLEGLEPGAAGLQLSGIRRRKVLRLAYDTPRVYGRAGARWYLKHHALAKSLSKALGITVHAYVFDPEELEQVVAYGGGRKVGGDKLSYDDVELPEEDELSETSFEALKSHWPLGHLAEILGISRAELLALPRAPSVLWDLGPQGAGQAMTGEIWDLLEPQSRPVTARAAGDLRLR